MDFPFISKETLIPISQHISQAIGVQNFDTAAAESVNQLREQLIRSNVKYDNLVLSLTETIESIPDEIEEASLSLIEIELDQYNDIQATLENLFDTQDELVITLDSGHCISLVKQTDGQGNVTVKCYDPNQESGETYFPILTQEEGKYFIKSVLVDTSGELLSMYDFTYEIAQASLLNDKIIQMCDVVTNPETATTTFGALVSAISSEELNYSNRTFIKNCVNAYSTGGSNGLASQLCALVRSMTHIGVSDSVLTFTDADAYVPQSFLVGFLDIGFTLVSAAATAIIGIFAPIAAGITLGISYIGQQISEKYKESYKEEYCSLNYNDVCLPFSPYPVYQLIGRLDSYEIPASHPDYGKPNLVITSANKLYKLTVDEGKLFCYFRVVGGFLYVGPRQYDSNGNINLWTMEFHPDLVYRVTQAYQVWNILKAKYDAINSSINSQTATYTYMAHVEFNITNEEVSSIQSILENAIEEDGGSVMAIPDGSGEYAGYIKRDEVLLQRILSANAFLWWMSNNMFLRPSMELEFDVSVGLTCTLSTVDQHGSFHSSANVTLIWLDILSTSYPTEFSIDYSGQTANIVLGNHESNYNSDPFKNFGILVDYYNDLNIDYPETGYNAVGRWGRNYVSGFSNTNNDLYQPHSEPVLVSSNRKFILNTPKYSRGSVLRNIVLGCVGLVVTATVIAFVTISAKKRIIKLRAKNASKVARAWDKFEKNPTSDNYEEYYRAVKKNNRMATIIGGNKYDAGNYWFPGNTGTNSLFNPSINGISSSEILKAIKGK